MPQKIQIRNVYAHPDLIDDLVHSKSSSAPATCHCRKVIVPGNDRRHRKLQESIFKEETGIKGGVKKYIITIKTQKY